MATSAAAARMHYGNAKDANEQQKNNRLGRGGSNSATLNPEFTVGGGANLGIGLQNQSVMAHINDALGAIPADPEQKSFENMVHSVYGTEDPSQAGHNINQSLVDKPIAHGQ